MSQLDMSISFNNVIALVICFYIFLHYVVVLFWYNQKLRLLSEEELLIQFNEIDNSIILKKILKM